MTWALKRQILFVLIFLIIISFFGYLAIRPIINVAPTCTDQKQNGTELGIDCGGSCSNACSFQVDDIAVLWARSFKVIPGRYNAVAYLENHNKNAAIEKINYRFRFADKNNVYIGKREGTTSIPPLGKFAIFEPAIDMGNSIPVYTTFEFTETPTWTTVSDAEIAKARIFLSNVSLLNEDSSPILSATVNNDSLSTVPDVYVVALLYDENHNATSVSRTYLSELKPSDKQNIVFTWREPFVAKIVSKELIPIYNIFKLK